MLRIFITNYYIDLGVNALSSGDSFVDRTVVRRRVSDPYPRRLDRKFSTWCHRPVATSAHLVMSLRSPRREVVWVRSRQCTYENSELYSDNCICVYFFLLLLFIIIRITGMIILLYYYLCSLWNMFSCACIVYNYDPFTFTHYVTTRQRSCKSVGRFRSPARGFKRLHTGDERLVTKISTRPIVLLQFKNHHRRPNTCSH